MALLLGTLPSTATAAPPLARRAQLAPLVPRLGVALRIDGLTDGSALGPARRGATIAAWLSWPLGATPTIGAAAEDARVADARREALDRRRAAWRRRAEALRIATAATGTLAERVEARLGFEEAQAELDAVTDGEPVEDGVAVEDVR
jgi:hypothetical protein